MKRLRAYIKSRYCTYKECANAIGVGPQLLSNFLKGRTDISRATFFDLADTLGLSLDELRQLMDSGATRHSQSINKYINRSINKYKMA